VEKTKLSVLNVIVDGYGKTVSDILDEIDDLTTRILGTASPIGLDSFRTR